MTRGTIHLILPEEILHTEQFNGDMYLIGHGGQIIERLERVIDKGSFVEELREFKIREFGSNPNTEFYPDAYNGNHLLMKVDTPIVDPTYADYTYWKNLSGRVITFVDVKGQKLILENGGIAVFNFCERYLKLYPREKE